jgi:hypothetical protein
MEAVFIPDFTCEPHVDPTCGTVGRSGSVVVSGGGSSTVRLWPGETASLVADHAGQLEIYLRRAQDRVALHPGCDLGTDTLGPEIEYVTRYHEAAE